MSALLPNPSPENQGIKTIVGIHEPNRISQTQAPKIRGLRQKLGAVAGILIRPNPSPENQGIKTIQPCRLRQRQRQTQAPKIRGLRHFADIAKDIQRIGQTQAPKIRGLRPTAHDVEKQYKQPNPSPENQGIKTNDAPVASNVFAKPKPRKSGD